MPKRQWIPKQKKRLRKHGFLHRMATRAGKLVLRRRRNKGRLRLAVTKLG